MRPQITKSQNNLTVRRCGSTLSKEFLNEWVFLHGETVLQTLQVTWGLSMPCIVAFAAIKIWMLKWLF